MKIAIHSNQFDGRGTGKVPYDYGCALRDFFNYDVVYITSKNKNNYGLERINKEFNTFLYEPSTNPIDKKTQIEDIILKENIDFIYMIKSGENDYITPENCKSGIHCVFTMTQPHGNTYAGVSKWLANYFGKNEYVPHIIKNCKPTENFRKKLGISEDYLVVGRHGGMGTFNIPFVKQAIIDILKHRDDLYFLFLSTEKFIEHERVKFIPWISSEQEIFNFINACDIMLHARMDGETFGLSIGEFSVANKPVLTWSGLNNGVEVIGYNKCHLDILNDKALIYNDYQDLLDILFSIDKSFINEHNWDKYSVEFSPENVIKQFKSVFLI